MEEFKYVRRTMDYVIGWLFLICGILFTIMHLVLLISTRSLFMLVVLVPFIASIFLGYFSLTKRRRTYVKKDSNGIVRIDRGPVYPDITFNRSEVSVVKKVNDELRIGLKSKKEYTIDLKLVSVFDIEKIEKLFV